MADSPAITTIVSAIPAFNNIEATVMASPPEEHAVVTVKLGPFIPYWIDSCDAAILPIYLVKNLGLTCFPFVDSSSCVETASVSPSKAVPITMPVL